MFPDSKVTEINCMADDFCKEFNCSRKNICLWIREVSIEKKPTV